MFESILGGYNKTQLAILREIYKRGRLTRAELTEATGFQLLTVTKTVSRLLQDGLIAEREHLQSTGGRKAVRLAVNPDFRYTLAVDLGASCARIGVVGMDGSAVEYETVDAIDGPGMNMPARHLTVAQLREKLAALIEKYGRDKILGLGIGASGVIDHRAGRIVFCPNIQGWNDVDVKKEFAQHLGIPVLVDTAARCMALAEYKLGAGQGFENLVCISDSTSTAAGILVDGKIYRGADGAAGEIGHTTVRADKNRCTCGKTGCLELYVPVPALISQAVKGLKDPRYGGFSPLKLAMQEQKRPTPSQLREAAFQGDKLALDILDDCAETMGTVVGYLINILNPNLIILGGALVEDFPGMTAEVARVVARRGFTMTQKNLEVRPYALGKISSMVGAALQVLDVLFQ